MHPYLISICRYYVAKWFNFEKKTYAFIGLCSFNTVLEIVIGPLAQSLSYLINVLLCLFSKIIQSCDTSNAPEAFHRRMLVEQKCRVTALFIWFVEKNLARLRDLHNVHIWVVYVYTMCISTHVDIKGLYHLPACLSPENSIQEKKLFSERIRSQARGIIS